MDLPQHLFDYVSSITPLVNVELVITGPSEFVLLSWRDDELYGPGWHLPGGIVRYKESVLDRIHQVAYTECSIDSFTSCTFLQVNQVMNPDRNLRGHFISLVFGISIDYLPRVGETNYQDGSIGLFYSAPTNLIDQHRRYADLINSFISRSSSPIDHTGNICQHYNLEH